MNNRICINCGLGTTHIDKNGCKRWHRYNDGYLCHKCYMKLISNPKWNPILRKEWIYRQMKFTPLGKIIYVKENPRKGVCKQCDKKIGDEYINKDGKTAIMKRTGMHHEKYHEDDPLKDAVELCASCHGRITMYERLASGK